MNREFWPLLLLALEVPFTCFNFSVLICSFIGAERKLLLRSRLQCSIVAVTMLLTFSVHEKILAMSVI